ncbi:MAG: hypothetical protein HY883_04810 [Deltaproteobacteria bacterium]|nr:hypothetical protein [Deltaproteobacteria bacterium]
MPVLSNGVNLMWKWPNYANPLTKLMGPPTLANGAFYADGTSLADGYQPYVCKAVTTAFNRLMVGNVMEDGGAYPGRVRWSDIFKPENWAKDLRGRSGGKDLMPPFSALDAVDKVQAFGSAGGNTLIYAERNVWVAENVEHPEIYRFSILMAGKGLIASRAQVKANDVNLFMGQDDFYPVSQDGEGIGFPIRNSVFANLNKSTIKTAFAFYKPSTKEVFFCYPTGTKTAPDTALVYQRETKAWSFCDCNYLCHSFAFDESGYTWDTLPYGSWDAISDSMWDDMGKTGVIPYEVVGNASGQILKFDSGNNDNGMAITGYIETGDLTMGDPLTNKFLNSVWPSAKPQGSNNALMVQVGSRQNLSQDIVWSNPQAFDIGISEKVSFRKQGKYIRIRFYTDQLDTPWILDGYGYDATKGGTR